MSFHQENAHSQLPAISSPFLSAPSAPLLIPSISQSVSLTLSQPMTQSVSQFPGNVAQPMSFTVVSAYVPLHPGLSSPSFSDMSIGCEITEAPESDDPQLEVLRLAALASRGISSSVPSDAKEQDKEQWLRHRKKNIA